MARFFGSVVSVFKIDFCVSHWYVKDSIIVERETHQAEYITYARRLQWIIQSPFALCVFLSADDEMAYSGDVGSGVGWEDEEEKENEETAEETEEEEGEVGEVDDGGYIW